MSTKKTKTSGDYIGRMPSLGITKYVRNGYVVTRISTSEGRSNTLKQFIQRQRMRHSIALWQRLSPCAPMFTQGKTAYHNFLSLANQLPAVYVPKMRPTGDSSLLMPDIPVSDGTMPSIEQRLGSVGGTPALITNRKVNDLMPYEFFLLYTAEQVVSSFEPYVIFKVREVKLDEFTTVNGCLALVDNDFANEMKGWALVRMRGRYCSSQGIVTRCKYYEQFTTEEALQEAAKTYGGLK